MRRIKEKLAILFRILSSKSPRYILFRSKYELLRRTGLLAVRFPVVPAEIKLPSLSDWRSSSCKYFFDASHIAVKKSHNEKLREDTGRILNGGVQFFHSEWKQLGLEYDWVTNPDTGYKYDKNKHWTTVKDFDAKQGDIKYVWEKSRFTFVYTLIRDDYHNGHDNASFVINHIINWIENNPINCGPNYKCSQEISVRLLNWLFALNYYKHSECLTEDKWSKIIKSIYWQISHVYNNIQFSRISVRNNHAITETLTLYIFGLLFPSLPGSAKWKVYGKKWFEKEIEYQFLPDGTYIQNSVNYQRVVTQLLSVGIAIAENNGERFADIVYDRALKNVNFLFQLQDDISGCLPNYGANDGALFFPLSSHDYCDFRPQLDALYHVLTNQRLYHNEYEESCWLGGYSIITDGTVHKQQGVVSFPYGGYYVIRKHNVFTFIRCGLFKGISGQMDQQHMDIWVNGENVLMDCGSYKYNTDEQKLRYYSGTESHNTVMLDDCDQMLKGPRFMWFFPVSIKNANVTESECEYIYTGEVESFKYIGKGIVHTRVVRISKEDLHWDIEDTLTNKPHNMLMKQIWHSTSDRLCIDSTARVHDENRFYSRYYGEELPVKEFVASTEENIIKTRITIKRCE